ncbi:MAG TPA: rRNA maturation RNase YbeY [Candidatus Limnocylindrales bacterium]|nr:rRNA maturation RNase YbeY [Candidatus Limnocylindrales bacterium]
MTRPHVVDGWRIEVTVRPGVPRLLPAAGVARVIATALAAGGAPRPASLSVVLTDDAELADLNASHLGHDGPTDVLSFPLLPSVAFPPHPGRAAPDDGAGSGAGAATAAFVLPPRARPHLGDIAISVERAIAQAAEGRGGQTGDVAWDAASELRLLLTHGALHVCGWDHAEPAEEAAMRELERRLLGS